MADAKVNYPADEQRMTIVKDVSAFVVGLAKEGERTAVVLGSARLDVALEQLLKKQMHHHSGGADNLFDPDRPLGTFSAKIALCHRLGTIDQDVKHALTMVRKMRNGFAHSIGTPTLSESTHKGRLDELLRVARQWQEAFRASRT
jgi:hypothetical protein